MTKHERKLECMDPLNDIHTGGLKGQSSYRKMEGRPGGLTRECVAHQTLFASPDGMELYRTGKITNLTLIYW